MSACLAPDAENVGLDEMGYDDDEGINIDGGDGRDDGVNDEGEQILIQVSYTILSTMFPWITKNFISYGSLVLSL